MKNKNHAQLTLYKSGLKELGTQALNGRSDAEIRMTGLKRMGKRAAGAVLAASGIVGVGAGVVHGINNMPPAPTEHSVQQDMNMQESQQGELTPAELQAKHQIDVQTRNSEEQAVAVHVEH